MFKKLFSAILALSIVTVNVSAASVNTLSRSNIVIRDESSLSFVNILIEPRSEVETGSSIVINVTNATIFSQDIIDGTSSDINETGYKAGGYQYAYNGGIWQPGEGFYDVMPNTDTAQLAYNIKKINDRSMEVRLINLPDVYVNNSMQHINGVSRSPYYSIPLVAYADGVGEITIAIDSNGTSISDSVIADAEIYEQKSSSSISETTTQGEAAAEASTEVTTAEINTDEAAANKSVRVQIGSYNIVVDGKDTAIDVPAYIQTDSQSTLVPLRAVSEAFGGDETVEWIPETKTAVIKYNNNIVEFTAKGDYMKVNGKEMEMKNNVKAEITNGRMFVPFRVLGEAMGLEVSWEAESKTAVYKASNS